MELAITKLTSLFLFQRNCYFLFQQGIPLLFLVYLNDIELIFLRNIHMIVMRSVKDKLFSILTLICDIVEFFLKKILI